MEYVPDVRDAGTRIALCAISLVLGGITAIAILLALPEGNNRSVSDFADLTVFIGMSMGAAIGWYALLDKLRERSPAGMVCVPSNLPVARLLPRRRSSLI